MAGEMPQTPVVVSMVLADLVHRDPATRKHYILGTFSNIFAAQFPLHFPAISIYLELTDARGPTQLRLRLIDVEEKRRPVFEATGVFESGDPIEVVGLTFRFAPVVFPEAGDYRLQLFAGDEFLRERRIIVDPPPER